MQTTENEVITVKEYAQRLGIAGDKILAWIRAGELQALNVATRNTGRPRYRLMPEAIERFERARSTAVISLPSPARRRKRRRTRADVPERY